MLRVHALTKTFGDFIAVDGIDFECCPGEVFGFLGPNGAGKSTAIGCISGLTAPTAGRVEILGHDVTVGLEARRSLGVVPQELALYEDLSARENLEYWGAAYGLRGRALARRIDEVLERIGLVDRQRDLAKNYSGGMKRRLNFGCGIVHRPSVLVLDEPTVAVDPQSRRKLLDLVAEEASAGTTVLYTTHYMEEAEELCRRIAVMDHGRIIASGAIDELKREVGERHLLRLAGRFEVDRTRAFVATLDDAEVVSADETDLVVSLANASERLPSVFASLAAIGAQIRETTLTEPNLESLFLKLTGRALRA